MTWDEINKKRLPYIRMGDRLFKGMYNEIKKQLKIVIQDWNTPEQITEAASGFRFDDEIVKAAYMRFYVRTGIHYARDMQKGISKRLELKDNTEDVWMDIIKNYVHTDVGLRIEEVTRTHYKDIERITKKAVELGIEKGWGADKIERAIMNGANAKIMKGGLGELAKWKALQISRTEVVAASNKGVSIGADELVGNKKKVWISTFSQTSRPGHMAMDGVRVAYRDDFYVDGEYLEFPGDPKGSAENIINCRCGYEIIVEPEIY